MNANEALKIFQEGKKAKEQELMIAGGGPLLPGESGGQAGLGSMSRDDVLKHMKQNPASAEKIWKKWNDLHGGIKLPLAQGKPQDQLMAGRPSNMPEYIYESIQRQYGNKKYGDYTIEDKKNVINWYKKMQVDAGGGDQNIANVWAHETPSDTFNRQNYPGRDASDDLRIDHMRRYHDMKKKELA